MRIATLLLLVVIIFPAIARSQGSGDRAAITAAELRQRNVIGELGIPLGTAAEIQAEVVAGSELHDKGYQSLYLLKVSQVDGTKLVNPPTLTFSVPPFCRVSLARTDFDLYTLKTGKKTGRLTDDQIEELEKGYVGKKIRLLAYEQGEFSGGPNNLPKDFPVWADRGFGFSTSLVVLKERTPSSTKDGEIQQFRTK